MKKILLIGLLAFSSLSAYDKYLCDSYLSDYGKENKKFKLFFNNNDFFMAELAVKSSQTFMINYIAECCQDLKCENAGKNLLYAGSLELKLIDEKRSFWLNR